MPASHDLRLAYTHRHNYKFIAREGNHYRFRCEDCHRHLMPGMRLIRVDVFWGLA